MRTVPALLTFNRPTFPRHWRTVHLRGAKAKYTLCGKGPTCELAGMVVYPSNQCKACWKHPLAKGSQPFEAWRKQHNDQIAAKQDEHYQAEMRRLRKQYPKLARLGLSDGDFRIAVVHEYNAKERAMAERVATNRKRSDHLTFLKCIGFNEGCKRVHLKSGACLLLAQMNDDQIIRLGKFAEYDVRVDPATVDDVFKSLVRDGAIEVTSTPRDGPMVKLTHDGKIHRRAIRRAYYNYRPGEH